MGARGEPKEDRVPFVDFLIINVPVWLFVAGIILVLSLLAVLKPRFPLALVFIAAAWWCVCGGVALGIDYFLRKRAIYLRIRRLGGAPDPGSALGRSLRQTVCGTMVFAAAARYSCTIRT
jgi:hypothetical protein